MMSRWSRPIAAFSLFALGLLPGVATAAPCGNNGSGCAAWKAAFAQEAARAEAIRLRRS